MIKISKMTKKVSKNILEKWKCSVCYEITESDEIPERCSWCGADFHKLKNLFNKVKKHDYETG